MPMISSVNWMPGIRAVFATIFLFVPIGVFFAGLGLVTLHAFGFASASF